MMVRVLRAKGRGRETRGAASSQLLPVVSGIMGVQLRPQQQVEATPLQQHGNVCFPSIGSHIQHHHHQQPHAKTNALEGWLTHLLSPCPVFCRRYDALPESKSLSAKYHSLEIKDGVDGAQGSGENNKRTRSDPCASKMSPQKAETRPACHSCKLP